VQDGYKGFVAASGLNFSPSSSSHWVNARATLVFENADIKSSVIRRLLFGSELTLSEFDANTSFLQLVDGGFVWAKHCEVQTAVIVQAWCKW